jgi:hypothetical protein
MSVDESNISIIGNNGISISWNENRNSGEMAAA